jgi:hypothetical protein
VRHSRKLHGSGLAVGAGEDDGSNAEPGKPGEREWDQAAPPHGTVVSQLKA